MKVRVLRQVAQLFIEHSQTFPRYFVRLNVIDTNLQSVKTSFIESLDSFWREVVTVGDQAGDHSTDANVMNDLIKLRMHHGLAARDRHDCCTQICKFIQTCLYQLKRYWVRRMVVFVAVTTSQITSAHGDKVR